MHRRFAQACLRALRLRHNRHWCVRTHRQGYELLTVASGILGLDPRTYLLASLLSRGGKCLLEAALVLALGDAVRSLGEVDLYVILGVVAIVVVAAYFLRRRWLPSRWRTIAG